jgi:hypothetical protein
MCGTRRGIQVLRTSVAGERVVAEEERGLRVESGSRLGPDPLVVYKTCQATL